MSRRSSFHRFGALAGPLLLLFSLAPAASARPVYLVELANFACPHCAHMEARDLPIQKSVAATGGLFDFAPVRANQQTDASQLVYFAARKQGQGVAETTRALLFEAMHQDGEPIQSVTQGVVFLQQDWPKKGPAVNFQELASDAHTQAVLLSAQKAQMLGMEEGVSRLPAFVFVQHGQPVALIARGPEYPSTAQIQVAVLAKIKQLSGDQAIPARPTPTPQGVS